MKEPDLEEEALTADVAAGLTVTITRRTMQPAAPPVQIARPDGQTETLPLAETAPGRFSARWTAPGTRWPSSLPQSRCAWSGLPPVR